MLNSTSLAVLSAIVSSLSPPGEVTIDGLLKCVNPSSPPPTPPSQGPVPPVPEDENLRKLLSLKWPRRDSEYYIKKFAAQFNVDEVLGPESSSKEIFEDLSKRPKPRPKPGKDDVSDMLEVAAFGSKHSINEVVSMLSHKSQSTLKSVSQQSVAAGEKALKEKLAEDKAIADGGNRLPADSPSAKHQQGFQKTDPLATKMAMQGFIIEKATKKFRDSLNLPKDVSGLEALPFGRLIPCDKARTRPKHDPCNANDRYRRLDGTCNNLQNPLWGASFTPFRRALLPDYGDGISALRKAASGQPLPSARLVSTSINVKHNTESSSFTILHMTFGQFLDHDLTSTPIGKVHSSYGDLAVKCCDDVKDVCSNPRTDRIDKGAPGRPSRPDKRPPPDFNRPRPPHRPVSVTRSQECAPIEIPATDPFFCTFRQRCMEFVRSSPAARCSLGPREQLNQLTAYLDGSVIYDTKETTPSLRAHSDGLLDTQITQDGVELLPPSKDLKDECNVLEHASKGEFCFVAGDHRVNEQRLLTLFQTVWAREHNRIARRLKNVYNVAWNDEKLFQETRRIVVAELQHVTYNEYLPTVLGPWITSQLNLVPLSDDEYTTDYDPSINAGIANAFAAAAFRFGHSEIADHFHRITGFGAVDADRMTSVFFNPFVLYKTGMLGNLARGGLAQCARNVDPYFTEEITNNLFKGSHKFGLDLVSLNLQRARDHGIPGYNTWRELCDLQKATSFSGLSSEIAVDRLKRLQNVYSHVDDIDLFIGGLSERPLTGGLLGPTLTCIISDQFLRIKRGDRYWYESKTLPGGAFTNEQLKGLHEVSLARILCDNIPELLSIQRWPLRHAGPTNLKSLCDDVTTFPSLNLQLWKD